MDASLKRERTCIACGKKLKKEQLYRLVRAGENTLFFDERGKGPGRGAYVCSAVCFDTATSSGRINRALRGKIENYDRQAFVEAVRSLESKTV